MAGSLLLVCRANLCRSPMAEAVYRRHATALQLDEVASAGVWAASRGERADPRALAALKRHELELPKKWRSRRLVAEDLGRYDWVLALDATVLAALRELWPAAPARRVRLLLDQLPALDPMQGQDVPDPYYSTTAAFDQALDLIERSVPYFRG